MAECLIPEIAICFANKYNEMTELYEDPPELNSVFETFCALEGLSQDLANLVAITINEGASSLLVEESDDDVDWKNLKPNAEDDEDDGVECIAEAHLFYVPKKSSDYFILNSSAHSGAILIFRMCSALRIADSRSNHDGVTPAAAAARLISASSLLPMIMCLRCFFVLGVLLVVILIFIESESAKCTSPSQMLCIAVFYK